MANGVVFGIAQSGRQSEDTFFRVVGPPSGVFGGYPNVHVFGNGGEGDLTNPPRGFTTMIREARGISRIHVAVLSTVPLTVHIQQGVQNISPPSNPPPNFVDHTVASTVADAATGLQALDITALVTRRFVRVKFDTGVGGTFGTVFECQVSLFPVGG